MKYIYIVGIFLVLTSCAKLLLGEKKLTYDKSTPYIEAFTPWAHENRKYYVIPIEKVKECRRYPALYYLGHENGYSFFYIVRKTGYEKEIARIALPDSVCVNNQPNTIDTEFKIYKGYRRATIEDNKMIVADY